jgi:TPR repeat protein
MMSTNSKISCMINMAIMVAAALLAAPATGELVIQAAKSDAELYGLWHQDDLAAMERVARSGDVRAQRWMGHMLHRRHQIDEALRWYQEAAAQGDGYSAHQVADFFEHGVGVPENDAEAARWNAIGANLGDSTSQLAYATALHNGRGVRKNPREALRWYLAAARQKNANAYFPLAEIYAFGIGTARDPITAYAFAKIAERAGDSSGAEQVRARELRQKLARELSDADLRQAQRRYAAERPDLVKHSNDRRSTLNEYLAALVGGFLGLLAAHRLLIRRTRPKPLGEA